MSFFTRSKTLCISCAKSIYRPLVYSEARLRRFPFPLTQLLYTFSSQYVLNSRFLNSLGLHRFRIRLSDRLLSIRRQHPRYILKPTEEPLPSYLDLLSCNGILRINNALPPRYFKRATDIAELVRSGQIQHKSFVKAGAEYREVVISEVDPSLYHYLSSQFWVSTVVKSYLAKRRVRQEWRIKLIRDYSGTFDNNTLWHADTFFSTLKAFIYLESVSKEQDVFQYLETSHLMSPDVLSLHQLYASEECRQPWPSDVELSSLDRPIFHEDISSNTLILADTRGLHRRHPKLTNNSNWRATLFCSFRCNPFKS